MARKAVAGRKAERAMQALHFDGKALRLRTMPRPRRRRGDALVRVRLAGICSTDLEILRGYMGFTGVPGHEFVGEVVAAPTKDLVGARVVGEINAPCGRCAMCRRGLGKHCARRTVLGIEGRNGAFAEHLVLPAGNLHRVPAEVTDEEAVFTELLAAACEAPLRAGIAAADRVAILGDGRLAAMTAQVIRLRTRRLTLYGTHEGKMATIRSLGIRARRADEATRESKTFDVVVECTGSPGGLPAAVDLVRPRGTVVLKSTFASPISWNPSSVAVDEITVIGSRCGPFDTALRLIAMREVATRPFLSAVYPLDRFEAAFRRARRRDAFKVVLRVGD